MGRVKSKGDAPCLLLCLYSLESIEHHLSIVARELCDIHKNKIGQASYTCYNVPYCVYVRVGMAPFNRGNLCAAFAIPPSAEQLAFLYVPA